MAREFSVIIQRDTEGYYVASVPARRGRNTQTTSVDELMCRVRDAIELCSNRGSARLSRRSPSHDALCTDHRTRGHCRVAESRVRGCEDQGQYHSGQSTHTDGLGTVVPVHPGETIGPGPLAAILRACEIDRVGFLTLLHLADARLSR